MKRTQQQRLEYESRLALRASLPKGWIVRDKEPDVGIDMEIEIVEKEIVTNKVIWVQVKATESKKSTVYEIPSYPYQMETEHLKYYESCRIPVIIVYGIKKSENVFDFYSLFAQEYIREHLSVADPNWRDKKTKTLDFESKLNIKDLNTIATKGYLYIAAQQLNITPAGAQYWLDGIPQSDNNELRERTLKALLYSREEKYPEAIKELENILRLCSLSPTEKMSILLNLGNACYSLSRIDNSLTNYEAVLKLTEKVTEKDALEGKSAALGNIGLIYRAKGDLDSALKYHQDAMKIHREIGYKQGEASDLGNIGLIYRAKGDLDSALKYHQDAMKIDKEIGYKQGEASDLGNIGLIYSDKGELDSALKYLQDTMKIHKEIGYKQGEASDLGNIGLIYRDKGDLDSALKYLQDAMKILDTFKLVYGRGIIENAINLITADSKKGR